jgi:arylsulfatase A-like enzyme
MTCYEGARIPCLVRWPGVTAPGSRCDALAANIDLAPTFWEAAGAVRPADTVIDGRSFAPLLRGSTPDDWRDELLLQICYANGVVTQDWKYIALRYPDDIQREVDAGDRRSFAWDGTENVRYRAPERFPGYFDYDQLYSLAEDPLEQHNLAADPGYAGRLAEMQDRLRMLLAPLPHSFGEFKTG